MEIVVGKKKLTLLKVYPKNKEEKDLLLFVDKYGIRECFQRCDIYEVENHKTVLNQRRKGKLSEADKERIFEELKKGTSREAILQMYNNVAKNQVAQVICQKRKLLGIKHKQKLDGKKVGRTVIQYDADMNKIATYDSAYQASNETGVNDNAIRYCCKNKAVTKWNGNTYIWRWADDQ